MKTYLYIILTFICLFTSCKKGFLDEVPNKSLRIPTTLSDFQQLLNNEDIMNIAPAINLIASDDYYITDAGFQTLSDIEKYSYLWSAEVLQGYTPDWNVPYQQVFYANVVLDGLKNIQPDTATQSTWDQLKGSALFYRAYAFYNIAQLFAKTYDKTTAGNDLGIPIRLEANVNLKSTRGTVHQTYDQIITDLTAAKDLLPVKATYKSKPSKIAVYAMLARVYQTMENYEQAESNATQCLALNSSLIDYNTLNSSLTKPFPASLPNGNDEVIYHSVMFSYFFPVYLSSVRIDSTLYNSYNNYDLRKTMFFNASNRFRGNYTGNNLLFAGLATDEIYLIKAECQARQNDISGAMNTLNILMTKRWLNTQPYTTLTANSQDDALNKILLERRKELVARGLRWTDLRRLNKDSRFAIALKRFIGGTGYTLQPNSNRYVFLIPNDEIVSSGIEQNPK